MRQTFVKQMMPNVALVQKQQHVFRWGVTILVVALAAFQLWAWAWLVLALAAFANMVDVGLAIVLGLSALAASVLPSGNTLDESSQRRP